VDAVAFAPAVDVFPTTGFPAVAAQAAADGTIPHSNTTAAHP
jgi:hypothetical protein